MWGVRETQELELFSEEELHLWEDFLFLKTQAVYNIARNRLRCSRIRMQKNYLIKSYACLQKFHYDCMKNLLNSFTVLEQETTNII